jgi:diguanylate cyclase (GGDEF)-like protein
VEIQQLFFRELEAGYAWAREAHGVLAEAPEDTAARDALRRFFHHIAGTAGSLQLEVLGASAALCEELCNGVERGEVAAAFAARVLGEGLTAVEATLAAGLPALRPDDADAPADGAAASPLLAPPAVVEPVALVGGEEREAPRVVVVDDDPVSGSIIDHCLRGAGFVSTVCTNADDALAVIVAEVPDLVVLDVVMPHVDGFELCRRVRAHPALQFTPVIFVTRQGDVGQRVRGLEAGGNDYIAKPFAPRELVARIRSHLQRIGALKDLAIRDGLTRCYNHKYFKLRFEQEFNRARRYGLDLTLALLDVDHFKRVNDGHGHPAGDAVLSHLASLLMASVRSTDVVARYGGEEFAILLVHAGVSESQVILNRIRERVALQQVPVPQLPGALPRDVSVTVSAGLAGRQFDDSPDALLQRADAALYAAKAAGRNRVVLGLEPGRAAG